MMGDNKKEVYARVYSAALGSSVSAQGSKATSSGVAANYRKVVAQTLREKSLSKGVAGQITPPHEIFSTAFSPGVCLEP